MSIYKKKLQLQNLIQKYVAIKGLINRNVKQDPSYHHVRFPFLLIAPAPGNDTVVTLEMQPNYRKLL